MGQGSGCTVIMWPEPTPEPMPTIMPVPWPEPCVLVSGIQV